MNSKYSRGKVSRLVPWIFFLNVSFNCVVLILLFVLSSDVGLVKNLENTWTTFTRDQLFLCFWWATTQRVILLCIHWHYSHTVCTLKFALTEDLLVVPACRCKLIIKKKKNLAHTENGFIMTPIFIPHLACWLN